MTKFLATLGIVALLAGLLIAWTNKADAGHDGPVQEAVMGVMWDVYAFCDSLEDFNTLWDATENQGVDYQDAMLDPNISCYDGRMLTPAQTRPMILGEVVGEFFVPEGNMTFELWEVMTMQGEIKIIWILTHVDLQV